MVNGHLMVNIDQLHVKEACKIAQTV
jgi:hypothetical protein